MSSSAPSPPRGGGDAFVVADDVRAAVDAERPIVALETSVIGQGLPPTRNLECVERMGSAVRRSGAVPAWIGVVGGSMTVGLSERELAAIAEPGASRKVTRRELPVALARAELGATTVSATLWAAHRAGIPVVATGGIGGVHPGGGDVSADLIELARTPGLLVCSGPKSIVDLVRTSERLEELGVVVVGFGTDRMPAFLAAASEVELAHRVDSPDQAAELLAAAEALGTPSTIVLCNPVPAGAALHADVVAEAVRAAQRGAEGAGVRGRELTPYLLARIAEETGGASVEANLALLGSNAALAGEIAAERARRR
jgi:pseudouridine-5'-phosphate glycosidase